MAEKMWLTNNSAHHLTRYLCISFNITVLIPVEAYQQILFDGVFQIFMIPKDLTENGCHKVTIIFIENNRVKSYFPSCFSYFQLSMQYPQWDILVGNSMECK